METKWLILASQTKSWSGNETTAWVEVELWTWSFLESSGTLQASTAGLVCEVVISARDQSTLSLLVSLRNESIPQSILRFTVDRSQHDPQPLLQGESYKDFRSVGSAFARCSFNLHHVHKWEVRHIANELQQTNREGPAQSSPLTPSPQQWMFRISTSSYTYLSDSHSHQYSPTIYSERVSIEIANSAATMGIAN